MQAGARGVQIDLAEVHERRGEIARPAVGEQTLVASSTAARWAREPARPTRAKRRERTRVTLASAAGARTPKARDATAAAVYSPKPGSRRRTVGSPGACRRAARRSRAPPPEVPRPGVVAEPRPGGEHRVSRGAPRANARRKPVEESVVPTADRLDRRLLQHDLRDPDAVGVPRAAPGELPLFAVEPGEQPVSRIGRPSARGLRIAVVTASRGAIQSFSCMRSAMNFFSSSVGRVSAEGASRTPRPSAARPDRPRLSRKLADRAVELHVRRDQRRRSRQASGG